MRVLLLSSHAVEEHDQLQLMHELGHEVFSIGAYIHPSAPMDPKRPALDVPEHPDLIAAVDALGQQGFEDTLAEAKLHVPDLIAEWAEVIIVSAYEWLWLIPQWPKWKQMGKRVIWRTIGQSGDRNEEGMAPLFRDGVEIVRYSPKERNIPGFAGESALIRFWKDPDEWNGWTGEDRLVTNVTQHMIDRDPWCNPGFWFEATKGLPVRPMGPGSENIGGTGLVTTEQMKDGLRKARAYLYTGTQPASYTLGLIEAGLTGSPIVSIGPSWMRILPYGAALFEAHELTGVGAEDPSLARLTLQALLADRGLAVKYSAVQRERFIALFGRETISRQW